MLDDFENVLWGVPLWYTTGNALHFIVFIGGGVCDPEIEIIFMWRRVQLKYFEQRLFIHAAKCN